eukprot:1925819-Ditylum_brightwellii.AAC.1
MCECGAQCCTNDMWQQRTILATMIKKKMQICSINCFYTAVTIKKISLFELKDWIWAMPGPKNVMICDIMVNNVKYFDGIIRV